ncbi:hypothetical protein BGZ73_004445 [Actinomortierella ambigua]|nr:hypothetical protein BGZ73_004445 [Actinomortierella ambigua]
MKEGRILLCTYSLISATIVNPQTVDPTIEADLSRDFFHPSKFNTTSHLDFTIVHLPQTPESDINQGSTPLISATQLIKNNIEASRYLASLGYNVQLYTDPATKTMRLYILYDVVKIRDVYYVSDVAFGTMCALAVFFLIIWFFSEKLYPTVYNGTIYKTIYKELRSNDGSTQMLMCCTYDTLKFGEGYVVPDQSDKSSVTPEAYSQEPRMAAVNPLDDEPSQSHELQPLVLLDEIPAQSPLLSRWSMIVPTPTMSPAIVNTADAPPVSVTTSLSLRETQLQPRRDDNLGTPPPIPPRIPRQSYSNTVHREDEAIVPSTVQNVTFIQSPFE